jgi:hypothetical protein
MSKRSPTTIHLDPQVARAARLKAAVSGKSLSDLANEGLKRLLREDDADLRIFKARRRSKGRPYEAFLEQLRKNGDI